MKLKLKMIAVAAAMASVAGVAHADLTAPGSNNGSLALVAFNTVTGAYYMRDTGFLLNDFLPSGVTTLSGDGSVVGNKTPAAGLTLDKTNTASFADATFSGWLAGQTFADVKWFLNAVDAVGTTTATNVKRFLTSSANAAEVATNGNLDGFVASGNAGGLGTIFGTGTLSVTGSGAPSPWSNNFNLGADGLAAIDQGVSLFYFSRTVGTGSTAVAANTTQFGNGTGFATVKLEADGDFSYTLAGASVEPPAAVPVPAAAWLMGSGLIGMGGFIRRRKAAAAAKA